MCVCCVIISYLIFLVYVSVLILMLCTYCFFVFCDFLVYLDVCFCCMLYLFFFFFKQKTAYEMRISDWSSDVCSSDLFLGFWMFTDPSGLADTATSAGAGGWDLTTQLFSQLIDFIGELG